MQNYKILLVDDDLDILEFMEYNLSKEGYEVKTAITGEAALKIADYFRPQLMILDVMMPGMDGIELCEEIRKKPKHSDVLIAFLTARGEDYSQIAGFDAGADDYITKPIKPKLLISRIKALLKRHNTRNAKDTMQVDLLESGNITIDKSSYLISIDGQEKTLPKKEFEILYLLATSPGKVFPREQIYLNVWGSDVIVGDRTIDVHIRKLREAIGNDKIQTVKGVGYKFIKD
jgi:two-component system alkaline phosphatase synthesis response regulator PhoP